MARAPASLIRCPDRDAWLAERANGVGASEAADIVGLGEHDRGPVKVWARKCGLVGEEPDNPRMRRGRILEPYVAQEFAEDTGLEVIDHGRETIAVHPEYPRARCSLDREVRHPEWGPGVLEIKTVGRSGEHGEVWGLDVVADPLLCPARTIIQTRWQMWCVDAAWGCIAAKVGHMDSPVRYWRVTRDAAWDAEFARAITWFWGFVEQREEPPARGPEDLPIVRDLHRYAQSGAWVSAPGELIEADEQHQEASAQLAMLREETKHWEGIRDTAEARLRQCIGEARGCLLPNGVRWARGSGKRLRRSGE